MFHGGYSGAASRGLGGNTALFPDPFLDIASMAMPRTQREALWWCERIAVKQGVITQALKRVVSYFITEVELTTADGKQLGRDEKQSILDFLNDDLGINGVLGLAGLDYLIYGISLSSVVMPFSRSLMCRGRMCGYEVPLRQLFQDHEAAASFSNGVFHAKCPKCRYSGEWDMIDRRAADKSKITVQRWSPHQIDIRHCPTSQRREYVWRIPQEYRNLIRSGRSVFHLESAERCVIDAITKNEVLLFNPDAILQMYEPAPAGITTNGWGFSSLLTNFGLAYYVQILMRYNESIAMDFVVPTRVVSPQIRPTTVGTSQPVTADPLMFLRGDDFSATMRGLFERQRLNPGEVLISPHAIDYQLLGGEANQLAPRELLDQGFEYLLSAIGIPLEMFKGTLSTQAAVPAMRQFEAHWQQLVCQLNRLLRKLVDTIGQRLGWEPVKARLRRASHADDLNRQMAVLQLMTQGSVSMMTGFKMLGLDVGTELRNKAEETQMSAIVQADTEKELQQAAQMEELSQGSSPSQTSDQAMAPTGSGGGPISSAQAAATQYAGQVSPDQPTTLNEMAEAASLQAQTASQMPPPQRGAFLRKLKQQSPELHALVTAELERLDAQMKADAYNQAKAQATTGPPPAVAA